MSGQLRIVLCFTLVLFAGTVSGHHSNAPHFDNEKEVEKTGVVAEWRFVNPHSFLHFDVTENGITQRWRCETDSASSLRRRGFNSTTFAIGEKLTVIGNPARREENACFFRDVVLADGTTINRNTDMALVRETQQEQAVSTAEEGGERLETLPNGDPNISGYWWDGDDEAPSGLAQALNLGGGMMGMGMGMGSARLQKFTDIPLTAEGERLRDDYDIAYDDPALQCQISNIMDALGRDESVNEIRQNENTITIMYGYMDYLRTIHMGMDAHPENIEPSIGGHSIGRWEGDTLIVDTIGFLPSVLHPRSGVPVSNQLHVVEQFRYDSARNELVRTYTANDPVYFQESFSDGDRLRPAPRPYEPYDCQPLSGLNNLRPGTPEYEEEAKRIKQENDLLASLDSNQSSSANDDVIVNDQSDQASPIKFLPILMLTILLIVVGYVVKRVKK